jgi:hypothetical protein
VIVKRKKSRAALESVRWGGERGGEVVEYWEGPEGLKGEGEDAEIYGDDTSSLNM